MPCTHTKETRREAGAPERMSNADTGGTDDVEEPSDAEPIDGVEELEEYPEWDDEYFMEVAGRLIYHYDLEKDKRAAGERFPMYGEMTIENKKHFLHPSIEIANHQSYEHLFAQRVDRIRTDDLDRLVELGHDLAADWIDPGPEHYSTEFTFVTVTEAIPDEVRSQVRGLDERTLLKYGYNGHYEVNLVVVAPEQRELLSNDAADVNEAFTTWEEIEREEPGLFGLIKRRLQL